MASKLRTLTEWIVSRLAVINGAGSYTYNLSGADQVVVDQDIPKTDAAAAVTVIPGGMATKRDGVPMGYRGRTATWLIIGRAKPTTDTPAARVYAAQDLLGDISECLESAEPQVIQAAVGFPVTSVDMEGDAFGAGGSDAPSTQGTVVVTLTIVWRVSRGT